MPSTPHSNAEHITANQVQLDLTANEAFDILDASVHAMLALAITASDYNLTATEYEQSGYIRVTGVFTAARTLTIPDNDDAGTAPRAKKFVVEHAGSAFDLTVETIGGTGVTISPGNTQLLYCDGTDVVAITGAVGSGGGPYDVAVMRDGLPGDGAVLFTHLPTRSFQLAAAFSGSRFQLGTATTGAIAFSVRKNGSEVGTIDFAASGTTATFTAASPTTFTSSDKLTIVGPSPQDATASDLAGTLKGSTV